MLVKLQKLMLSNTVVCYTTHMSSLSLVLCNNVHKAVGLKVQRSSQKLRRYIQTSKIHHMSIELVETALATQGKATIAR